MASLVRWDPFNDLVAIERDMGRLIPDIGGWLVPPRRRAEGEAVMMTPTVDVVRRGEDMVVRAEIPGVKPEEVDISVTDNMLTLKGERHEEHESKDEDYYVRERSWGTFERTLRLPPTAEVDHIKAEVHDGVLEITVPKAAHQAPETRHIEVMPAPEMEHPEHH